MLKVQINKDAYLMSARKMYNVITKYIATSNNCDVDYSKATSAMRQIREAKDTTQILILHYSIKKEYMKAKEFCMTQKNFSDLIAEAEFAIRKARKTA